MFAEQIPDLRAFTDSEPLRQPNNERERTDHVRACLESRLDQLAEDIERRIDSDVMAIVGPIYPGLEADVRFAIETRIKSGEKRRSSLAVVLQTDGGVVEVVERMVHVIRHHYDDVTVIVPDNAMSAGTVFAMSADRIMMSYYSCLGPIDPQIERGGVLVPALSYLVRFERLRARARAGGLTGVDMTMLTGLDLAEPHTFEKARELSSNLLKDWLVKYKFKSWTRTEARGIPVTLRKCASSGLSKWRASSWITSIGARTVARFHGGVEARSETSNRGSGRGAGFESCHPSPIFILSATSFAAMGQMRSCTPLECVFDRRTRSQYMSSSETATQENPRGAIDAHLIDDLRVLGRLLRELGLPMGPGYRLSPPLGRWPHRRRHSASDAAQALAARSGRSSIEDAEVFAASALVP